MFRIKLNSWTLAQSWGSGDTALRHLVREWLWETSLEALWLGHVTWKVDLKINTMMRLGEILKRAARIAVGPDRRMGLPV